MTPGSHPSPILPTAGAWEGRAADWRMRARQAQEQWARIPWPTRRGLLRRARRLMCRDALLLARLVAAARQCSDAEALVSEILPLAEACRFLERETPRVLGSRRLGRRGRPAWLSGVSGSIERVPWGVILLLGPSNYPLFLVATQALQAIAAANAVLLKPGAGGAEPLAAWLRILTEAGLPVDLLQLLPDTAEAGQQAVSAGVDRVVLTGRDTTGVQVLGQAAERLTSTIVELSGCDAVVVREDADLALVTRALVFGLRLNRGATCIAPRRVLVDRSVATELEGRLAQALQGCERIELETEVAREVFPLANQVLERGAHLIAGQLRPGGGVTGPMVLAGVPRDSRLLRSDLFAPVLSLITTTSDTDALAVANASPYGLGAAIFTRDPASALPLAQRLEAGIVEINDLIVTTADPRVPFGGRKRSGFGVTRGAEGLLEMTVPRVILQRRGSWRPHYDAPHPDDAALFTNYLQLVHGSGLALRFRALRGMIRLLFKRRRSP
jgi:acyl-CoA reductase-like NAD-dependent aldehyde dehydrogenase